VKILITGGTGMLGKNMQQSFKNNNLPGIFVGRGQNDEFNLLNWDKTHKLFSEVKPDVVVHAAANVGGINYNMNNPGTLIKENLLMGINVLDACVEFGVSHLYIPTTCCAYPKFCPAPFKEDDLWNGFPEESNSGYGIAKKTIVKMSQDYRQQFGLKATCFISANLYGPHDHFDLQNSHVIPALIRKFTEAKKNNLPFVNCWGTGSATRDMFFVADLADTLVSVINNQFDYPDPINLGTGKDISIKSLAHLIALLIDYTGKIIFTGEVSDGQPKRLLDIGRAQKILDWSPSTLLQDGLQQTIEWYRQTHDKTL
jgi:GDP-L-fucose synthase